MAKKLLFTEQITGDVLRAYEEGATDTLAAYCAGISPQTLLNWLEEGEKDISDGIESELGKFYQRAVKAKWGLAGDLLGNIIAAAEDDWRASAWLAERLHPAEYGKTVSEHKVKLGTPTSSLIDAVATQLNGLAKLDRKNRGTAQGDAGYEPGD